MKNDKKMIMKQVSDLLHVKSLAMAKIALGSLCASVKYYDALHGTKIYNVILSFGLNKRPMEQTAFNRPQIFDILAQRLDFQLNLN